MRPLPSEKQRQPVCLLSGDRVHVDPGHLAALAGVALVANLAGLEGEGDIIRESELIRDTILPKMCQLRIPCDEAETMTAKEYWPYPTYGDLLFSVK